MKFLSRKLYMGFEIRHVRDHVEVFLDGRFQFSADTVSEAIAMIRCEEV